MGNAITAEQRKRITVKRVRCSATQGAALICVDGVPVPGLGFGDDIQLIDGEWKSTMPDERFILAAVNHPLDHIFHYNDMLLKALTKQ